MANLVLVLVNLIALPALLVFVVIINPSSHSDAVFVSIDCGFTGSSSTYKDENSIVWTGGDEAYIHNKHESQVFNEYYSSNTPVDWTSTARVFPTLNKNCYTIPIGKAGERLLV
ncbi:hypothetical protein CerSpe_195330 [Prunus speciosa]